MIGVIKFFGGLTAIVGLAAIAFAIFAVMTNFQGFALIAAAWGAGMLLSGAMLYCFGDMASQLRAIRKAVETPR